MKCFYFGCWNTAGHFLRGSELSEAFLNGNRHVEYYGDHVHIDGTLAPRRVNEGTRTWRDSAERIIWQGQGTTREERQRLSSDSAECDQGQFLLHHLDNGYTAIQWWDRTQGDTRMACNSTVLLEGVHAADVMLAALAEHFPSVLANLTKAGVTLREVAK